MTGCVFCSIIGGSEASTIVFSDDAAVAFLDRRPVFEGHTLVVPRPHVVTLPELDGDLVGPFFRVVQRVAGAMVSALGADGSFVALNNTVSQSVAHLHVHVVPRHRGDGLRGFFWPRRRYESDSAMETVAERLRAELMP